MSTASTKPVSIKLDPAIHASLKALADERGTNVSAEVRRLLKQALAAEGLDLYGNEVADLIRRTVDARMDVMATSMERRADDLEDRIAAVVSRPMVAAILSGLISADLCKAAFPSLDNVPVERVWSTYLAQAGELSRLGLGKIAEVKQHARERADG